jgi:hypothetical protein
MPRGGKYFTDDAHITLTMPEAYGGQTLHLTREQYRERIDQAHAQVTRCRYERRDTKIAIDPCGQTALVTATLVETAEVGDLVLRSKTQATSRFALKEGKPVIVSTHGIVMSMQ